MAANGWVRAVGQLDADPFLQHLAGFQRMDSQGTISIVRQVSHACLDGEFYGIRVALTIVMAMMPTDTIARFFAAHQRVFSNGDL